MNLLFALFEGVSETLSRYKNRPKMEEKDAVWFRELSEKLEYFLDTEEGRREFLAKAEERAKDYAILAEEEERRGNKREIIWLSYYCLRCKDFVRLGPERLRCEKFHVRLVKPFYGRAIWSVVAAEEGGYENIVKEIDWEAKIEGATEAMSHEAMRRINNGLPYPCYTSKVSMRQFRPSSRSI